MVADGLSDGQASLSLAIPAKTVGLVDGFAY